MQSDSRVLALNGCAFLVCPSHLGAFVRSIPSTWNAHPCALVPVTLGHSARLQPHFHFSSVIYFLEEVSPHLSRFPLYVLA